MNFTLARFVFQFAVSLDTASTRSNCKYLLLTSKKRKLTTAAIPFTHTSSEELLVVVGGGAAGVYGAIRAKTVAPKLNVVIIEKGKPLSKVKISGGGRCNVTNGHCADKMILAGHYPRGHKEFRGSFFSLHGPMDTMSWFSDHGVELKTEDDGRVFPVSDSSSSVIDCLLTEAKHRGGMLEHAGFVLHSLCDLILIITSLNIMECLQVVCISCSISCSADWQSCNNCII